MKLWAGRFQKETDTLVNDFNSSIGFDARLYQQDIRGSIAHAAMLGKQGIIEEHEAEKIIEGLKAILADIEDGKVEFSMDNGKTWTPYDLGQTDPSKWVYWHYTWTPESDGSYVLMVRGTTDTGLVGTNIQKVMVTAKSNVEG